MTGGSALYEGTVAHRRLRPRRHRLRYRVFSLLLDIDEVPALCAGLRLLSHRRFNLFNFDERDHGDGTGGSLREWVETHLAEAGIDLEVGTIRLLAMPRVLGYGFNPISVWFCYHRSGRLAALLHEVHNTFGERHTLSDSGFAGRLAGGHRARLREGISCVAVHGDGHALRLSRPRAGRTVEPGDPRQRLGRADDRRGVVGEAPRR